MGLYIEPPRNDKKAWLIANSDGVIREPNFHQVDDTKLLVCLIDNHFFFAGAVCYSEREFDGFNDPSDRRVKQWFAVDKRILKQVCPDWHIYIKG
jgi:hypothetical protein